MDENRATQLTQAMTAMSTAGRTDLLVYNGPIDDVGFGLVVERTNPPAADTVTMILTTLGGDADAAYRIAKLLCRRYKTFRILVSSYCKSAGTLIALGASELIMADTGELGPLDVQIRKRDELLQRESGLEMVQGLQQLTNEALDAFTKTFIEVASGAGLSTRLCADIAANFVGQLYGNIFSQIDPIRLGSVVRANAIAMHYGQLLGSKNLKPDALGRLVLRYPSHDFVIDRSQAEQLFNSVRAPNQHEQQLVQAIEASVKTPNTDKHVVVRLPQPPPGVSHGTPKLASKARGKRKASGSGASPARGVQPASPAAPELAQSKPGDAPGDGATRATNATREIAEAVVPSNGSRPLGQRQPRASSRRLQSQGKN